MKHLRRSGPLVEIVDVLRDDIYVIVFLQLSQQSVGLIGLLCHKVMSSGVVELMHEFGVAAEAIGRCHLHYGIILPQSSGVAEGGDAAFGTDAGPGRYN